MDITNEEEYKRILRREQRDNKHKKSKAQPARTGFLRVIGGELRSRKIQFKLEAETRPMKDRTREAIFNLLGHTIQETIAVDLFAGSGILAFESLSRGAAYGLAVEKIPFRAGEISENAKRIQIADFIRILTGDAFKVSTNPARAIEGLGIADESADLPWTVFCCPPYELWSKMPDQLRQLVRAWMEACPTNSNIVIELEQATAHEFDFDSDDFEWMRRDYRPATVCIGTKIVKAAE